MKSKNHKVFTFQHQDSTVEFSSDFECGNLSTVQQLDQLTYSIYGEPDTQKTTKSAMYFSVAGFPVGSRVRFRMCRVDILCNFYAMEAGRDRKPETSYQFCVRRMAKDWQRVQDVSVLQVSEDKQLVLSFSYTFCHADTYEFAFNYPYTYERQQLFLQLLRQQYSNSREIYYDDQIPAVSRQGRNIRLITISNRSSKSVSSKPVMLVTARVHPSQSPSSYVVEGIMNFLLNMRDQRSHLLRETFTIIVMPMLNPDGVVMGNFRYDDLNQNLNRYYLEPSPACQPSILAAHNIITQLSDRLMFYFDLHAHHSPKGCFIYGNAFDDIIKQVQARVFCKVMSINNRDFDYQNCNHSQTHMTSKDKQDTLSKKGCGRVFAYKQSNIVHSYTVECGYYRGIVNQQVAESNLEGRQSDKLYTPSQNTNCERTYTPSNYRQIGRDLMISVLDVLSLNPYTKILNSEFKQMQTLRKTVSTQVFYAEQRFRRTDSSVVQKLKNVNALIQNLYMQWQINIVQVVEDKRVGDRDRQVRAQTQLRYNRDLFARKDQKRVISDSSPDQVFHSKKSHHINTQIIPKPQQSINSQSIFSRPLRNAYTPAICSIKNSSCTPMQLIQCSSKSQIRVIIQSNRQRSIEMRPKHLIKLDSRKTMKTVPTDKAEKIERRIETEIQTVSPYKQSAHVEYKFQAQDQARRTIVFGRQQNLFRTYQRRRTINRKARDSSKQMWRLPKLQKLLQVKKRIIQQCRLQYILRPHQP